MSRPEDDAAAKITDAHGNELQAVMTGGKWNPRDFDGDAARRIAIGDFIGGDSAGLEGLFVMVRLCGSRD